MFPNVEDVYEVSQTVYVSIFVKEQFLNVFFPFFNCQNSIQGKPYSISTLTLDSSLRLNYLLCFLVAY